MLLLDTSICVAVMRGWGDIAAQLARHPPAAVALSVISLVELRAGAASSDRPVAERARVDAFIGPFTVLPFVEAAVDRFVDIHLALRRRGRRIGDLDLLIAATAQQHQYTLVALDRDYLLIPGLRVEVWSY